MAGVIARVEAAVHSAIFGDEDTCVGIVDEELQDFDDMWSWHRALNSIRKGSWGITEALERAMLRELKGQAIRIDDFLVYGFPQPPGRRIINPQGLADYLKLSTAAQLCFRTTDIRIQGVRAWAKEQGDDPDKKLDEFFDFVGEEGPVKLRIAKMENAPFWGLDMRQGERRDVPPPKWREPKKKTEPKEAEAS